MQSFKHTNIPTSTDHRPELPPFRWNPFYERYDKSFLQIQIKEPLANSSMLSFAHKIFSRVNPYKQFMQATLRF